MLEKARTLSNNESFLVRWMTGVVYAQLPDRFNKADAAMADLKWCVDNISKAPHDGWLREVFYHLAVLYNRTNDQKQAQAYLQLSGYDSFDKRITLTTPYAVNATKGHTFYPKRLREIVPGKIFNLSGFEFTEYYFVVSKDGKELISIDAGTRPDSAQGAYAFLRNRFPDLPPLTTGDPCALGPCWRTQLFSSVGSAGEVLRQGQLPPGARDRHPRHQRI